MGEIHIEERNSQLEDEIADLKYKIKLLERNSLFYTQLRYILSELLESPNPNAFLALFMREIVKLTGGKPALAVEFHEGLWEKFSLEYYKKENTWIPKHEVNSRFYSQIVNWEPLCYVTDSDEFHDAPEEVIRYTKDEKIASLLLIPQKGKPRLIIEVCDMLYPEQAERYLEAVREFIIPLRLSIQHAMLLEESNRSKNQAGLLLDIIFHDIRGHLSSLQITLELMEIQWDNREKTTKLLIEAREQTRATNSLLNRVKKLLVSGTRESLQPVCVRNVIEESIKSVRMQFPNDDITIDTDFKDELQESKVLADDLLLDVFVNLLSNSVKSMDQEDKRIVIEIDSIKSSPKFLRVSVIDYGKGMPEELRPKITGRFFTQSSGGFGLGLSIIMRVIDNYMGFVWYEERIKGEIDSGTKASVALRIADSSS